MPLLGLLWGFHGFATGWPPGASIGEAGGLQRDILRITPVFVYQVLNILFV